MDVKKKLETFFKLKTFITNTEVLNNKICFTILIFNQVVTTTLGGITNTKLHASALQREHPSY